MEQQVTTNGSALKARGKKIRVAERRELPGSMIATGFPPRERGRTPAQLDCLNALLVHAAGEGLLRALLESPPVPQVAVLVPAFLAADAGLAPVLSGWRLNHLVTMSRYAGRDQQGMHQ